MARMNKNLPIVPAPVTHEGGQARNTTTINQLRRSVLACLLWEDTFYESGEEIGFRIARLVSLCDPKAVAALAIEARTNYKLRHVPLLLVRELARHPQLVDHPGLVRETLYNVIQRADELAEFVAIYWKNGKAPLSAQVKKGLAAAFEKFSEYDLAKYNRDGAVKLRDVLFLTHAKPRKEGLSGIWEKLVNGTLATPDTWEVAISATKKGSEEQKRAWRRLLVEEKLGALALLRNLRNLQAADIPMEEIAFALGKMKTDRVLPFRFISAARFAPILEPVLEAKMLECVKELPKLAGNTLLLVDVSGSMVSNISNKSDLRRLDAACGLAILLRAICDNVVVAAFSDNVTMVPARVGFALRDAICRVPSGGTRLGAALTQLKYGSGYDRLIVLTDEQSHDNVAKPLTKGYMVNVAAYKNGVGYGDWNHVDGWSESIVRYIQEFEQEKSV